MISAIDAYHASEINNRYRNSIYYHINQIELAIQSAISKWLFSTVHMWVKKEHVKGVVKELKSAGYSVFVRPVQYPHWQGSVLDINWKEWIKLDT